MTALLLTLLACGGTGDSAATVDPACGDIDGAGGDSGDVPSVIGSWTSTFANAWWDDLCSAENFDEDSETWIGSFYVEGEAPANLYVYFGPRGDPRTDRFWGAVDDYGGVTFSGLVPHSAGTIHATFGGKTYTEEEGGVVIIGGGFLGLDIDGDDTIDCYGQGNWRANKSGD